MEYLNNWYDFLNEEFSGPTEIGKAFTPYNTGSGKFMNLNIPIRKSRNHGSTRDKKKRPLPNIPNLKKPKDFKKTQFKKYSDFVEEGLSSFIGAVGLGLASMGNPNTTQQPFNKTEVSFDFFQYVINKYPDSIDGNPLPISILENEFQKFNKNIPLTNLNNFSNNKNLPINIRYFYINALGDIVPILNIDYTNAINIYGHDIKFNFTRVGDINTFGAKINF